MRQNFEQQPIKGGTSMQDGENFDDVPIGSTGNINKFAISQYADGEGPPETGPTVSTANMTLQQKLQSKAVKIKLEGLEDLKNTLSDPQKCGQIQIQLAKILKQNNPACLEKALQCMQKWMEMGKNYSDKQIKQLIQNGYINGKGATKKLATDLIFKAFQTKPDQVQKTIVQIGLKGKVPKIIGGYFSIINQLLQQFGAKSLKFLKPYLPTSVNVMNNQKLPALKTQGMNLFKNGLKWLGKQFMWTLLSQLKDNMKKQLQAFWQSHDKTQVMKANRQKTTTNNATNKTGQTKNKSKQSQQSQQTLQNTGGLDIYQISDPVQIFHKFDQKWSQTVLQTEKWNSKISLIQQLINKVSVPKIANSQHRHVTQMMRRLINDSNFNVVLTVLKLAGALAKGLRKNFGHSAKLLFPYITPKFRDKKTQMIQQTFSTLNNFCFCFSLEEVGQDIKTALKDKAAGMKNNIIKWITTAVEKSSGSDRTLQFFKSNSFQNIMESLLNDPSSDVRDSTIKLVCKVKLIFGDGVFKNIDKNINNKDILNKINEGYQGQQNLAKSRSKDEKGTSSKKQKTQSKPKNSKQAEQQDSIVKNTYTIKSSSKQGSNNYETVDITEQLNKNMKKLNDSSNWQNRRQTAQKLIKYFSQLQKQHPNAKIVSALLYDFLGVIKNRISDPNKQLVKIFVQLVGQVFRCLSQKQAKIQGRLFVQQLIQVFSDKNQQNRKQVNKTLDRMAQCLGYQAMISTFGQILNQQLSNNNNSSSTPSTSTIRQYTLQYLANNQYFLSQIQQIVDTSNLKQFKQFPKIILTGLCDKSKQLRAICERIYRMIAQKTGIQIFKSMVNSKAFNQGKNTAFKNDLIAFIDKNDTNSIGSYGQEQPSMISNGSNLSLLNNKDLDKNRSPSISKQSSTNLNQDANLKNRRKMSNVSNVSNISNNSLCNSRSKPKNNSILIGNDDNKQYMSNLSFYLKDNTSDPSKLPKICGSQPFAPTQLLTSQRISRQQASTSSSCSDAHPISYESQLKQLLSHSVNYNDIFLGMYSQSYHKVLQSSNKLLKLARDIAYTGSIRQIGDLLLKWICIRLHGGNVSLHGIIELVCPILSVLEKKRVVWGQNQVAVCVFLIRQYLVTVYYVSMAQLENTSIQIIKNICKLVIAISSGQRVIRRLLLQLKLDPNQFHRHLSNTSRIQNINSFSRFYKKHLIILCSSFIDYFSNDTLLGQAANIPQLCQDAQFIKLLSNKFCQAVLKDFGFKLQSKSGYSVTSGNNNGVNIVGVNLQKSFINVANEKNNFNNIVQPAASPRNISTGMFFAPKSEQKDNKNKRVTPQKNNHLHQSHFPPPSPSPAGKAKLVSQSYIDNTISKKQTYMTLSLFYKIMNINDISSLQSHKFDISQFPNPNPHNPLGSHLLKLYPYNESSIHFFSTLFLPQNTNNPKISSQLSTNSQIIYTYLFHNLQKYLELQVRESQHPQRLALFLTLVQHCIKCGPLYTSLSQTVIQRSIRFIIDQLVYEDQNKNIIQSRIRNRGYNDYKPDAFVKGVNGIMLRMLDNSEPLFLVNVLIFGIIEVILEPKNSIDDIQALYSSGVSSQLLTINRNKKSGLLMRCINRLINSYFSSNTNKQKQKQTHQLYSIDQNPSCIKPSHITKFLLLCDIYISSMLKIQNLLQYQTKQAYKHVNNHGHNNGNSNITSGNSQQSIVLGLCKIMKVLNKKGMLVKNYQLTRDNMGNSGRVFDSQRVIGDYVRNIAGVNTYIDNNSVANISNSHEYSMSAFNIDDELKKIIQLLSKTKSFNDGVKQLKIYIQEQNGSKFDYKSIFIKMGFENKFIQKVAQQLNSINMINSSASGSNLGRSINPQIQNKLQRLKMKLQGINNDHSKSKTPANSTYSQLQSTPSYTKPAHIQQNNINNYNRMPASSSSTSIHTPKSSSILQHTKQTNMASTINTTNNNNNNNKSIDASVYRNQYLNSTTNGSNGITVSSTSAQNDLKRRIQEMKNKVTSTMIGNNNNGSSNSSTSMNKIR